jgi:trehalose 6-phosphate phosphatase
MVEVLRSLSLSDRIRLAVISGRALNDLRHQLPIERVILAGNHGLEIDADGTHFEHEAAHGIRPYLEQSCRDIKRLLTEWPGAWLEDKQLSLTVHYRDVHSNLHHDLRCAIRRSQVGRNPMIGLRPAIKALELYPKVRWDKGAALNYIREISGPFDVCIAIGDDATDESMFLELPENINIKVGQGRPTTAMLELGDPSGVAVFLQHVLDVCELHQPEIADTAASGRFVDSRGWLLPDGLDLRQCPPQP